MEARSLCCYATFAAAIPFTRLSKLRIASKVAGRQRLAALAGILCRSTKGRANSKVVVFFSSKDSVEFHQQLFQGAFKFVAGRPLVDCPIYKLHGSLMQVCPEL